MTPSGRKRVLLAEIEDRAAIALLARLYAHNRTYDVLLSRTADVTKALVQAERFSVIVLHAHPSKPSDVAQLCGQLGDTNDTRVLALIDSEVDAGAGALYAAGADLVLEVRTPATQLAEEVVRVSRTQVLLEGRLEQLSTPELVQTLCLCRRSLTVRIKSSVGNGMIWLQDGDIHHAVCENMSGQAAMSALVRADNGRFWAFPDSPTPMRSIQHNWQHVLLEAAREGDEARESTSRQQAVAERGLGPAPNQSQVRKLGNTYRELTELGLQSIKAGDFSKAREYWAAARALGTDAGEPEPAGLAKTSGSMSPPRRTGRR